MDSLVIFIMSSEWPEGQPGEALIARRTYGREAQSWRGCRRGRKLSKEKRWSISNNSRSVKQAKAHTGVDVAEEDIAEDPEAHRVIGNETANTVLGTIRDRPEAERVLRDREVLALNRDRAGSLAFLFVDALDSRRVAVEEGSVSVDDRVGSIALVRMSSS